MRESGRVSLCVFVCQWKWESSNVVDSDVGGVEKIVAFKEFGFDDEIAGENVDGDHVFSGFDDVRPRVRRLGDNETESELEELDLVPIEFDALLETQILYEFHARELNLALRELTLEDLFGNFRSDFLRFIHKFRSILANPYYFICLSVAHRH